MLMRQIDRGVEGFAIVVGETRTARERLDAEQFVQDEIEVAAIKQGRMVWA
jgi:hypothetical protein